MPGMEAALPPQGVMGAPGGQQQYMAPPPGQPAGAPPPQPPAQAPQGQNAQELAQLISFD